MFETLPLGAALSLRAIGLPAIISSGPELSKDDRHPTTADRTSRGRTSRPVALEKTSLRRYVTGRAALNVVVGDEWSGDWHFLSTWFSNVGNKQQQAKAGAALAGDGQVVDTNPFLGTRHP